MLAIGLVPNAMFNLTTSLGHFLPTSSCQETRGLPLQWPERIGGLNQGGGLDVDGLAAVPEDVIKSLTEKHFPLVRVRKLPNKSPWIARSLRGLCFERSGVSSCQTPLSAEALQGKAYAHRHL